MSSVEDEDSWIVLSSTEQSGVNFRNEPFIKLEVYVYPDDCLPAELVAHFLEVFDALCITPENEIDRMFNETKTYVLAFRLTDAKKILKVPTQLLEEEETGSKIQIRVLQTKSHSVLFGCGTERVNARMVRKSLRGIEIHSCKPMGECAIIVTFKNLEDAERVVTQGGTHPITQRLSAHVSYCDELFGNEITMMTNIKIPAVEKQTEFERPGTPNSGESFTSSLTLNFDMPSDTDSSILQALSTSATNQKHRQDTGALCQSFRMSPPAPLSVGVQEGQSTNKYTLPAASTRNNQADSGSPNRSATKSHRQGRNSFQSNQAAAGPSMEKELETLLISNLLDVDEQTLSYWVKSVTGLWPISIQLDESGEKAVVKIQGVRPTDFRQIQRKQTDKNLHIHGERLKLEQVKASNEIQVTVSSPNNDRVHPDIVSGYFSNPRNTGVNSANDIVVNNHPTRKDTFIISYQTPHDVRVVLNRKPHRAAGYDFDVAEYYEGIGLSKSGSLTLFSYPTGTMDEDEPIHTSLNIFDVRKADIDTIELLMAAKTRTKGGPIKSFIKINQSTGGVYKVNIIYEEDSVAERVYDYHRRKPISCNGSKLKIELESPTLQEYHDKQSVRISGLTADLDPEKLKFYISALADNLVTQMCFDGTQTKAVATLSLELDYATMLYHHNKIGLDGCPELKLQQEEKPSHLLAVGNLTKDAIELTLESYLQRVTRDADPEVMAELFENTTDKWKIDTGHKALYKADLQHIKTKLPGCNQLMVYSEHLGLNMTTGTYKKTKELSEIVSDQRMLEFLLLTTLPGHDALVKHLQGHGFIMKPNGSITVNINSDNKNNRRRNLHNWRSLNQCVEKFVLVNCLIYETEQLTEQVYSHMVKNMQDLTKKLSVALYLANNGQQSAVNTISVVGEKSTIENLKQNMLSQIKAKEKLIQDERITKPVVVPNIMEYQLEYLDKIGFFKDMKVAHKLKDIQLNPQNQSVTITGLPSAIDQVQKQMLDLLPKVAKSKCSESKKSLFLNVFASKFGKESVYNEFENRRVTAVWTIENRTVSMYSETKELASAAMDCLNDVIWEAQYPVGRDFDELEKQLITTQDWRNKKAELESVAEPLLIVPYGDRPALSLVGLKYKKGYVLEEISAFFETNVKRKGKFQGKGRRISYLYTYSPQRFAELAKEFFVELKREPDSEEIEINGTRNSIDNANRAIQSLHQTVTKDEYTVDSPAMVQHIKNDRELLENVGLKRKCLITIHEEESGGLLSKMSQWNTGLNGLNYVYGGGSTASSAGRGPQMMGRSSAHGAMSEDVMLLDIYGSNTSDIEECKRDLERKLERAVTTMLWSEKSTYIDDKELIMKLQEDRISWIVQRGNEMHVRVTIDKRLQNIRIAGLPRDVAAMSDLVTRELKNIDKRIHQESVEEMLYRTISWEYNQSGCTWTKFDPAINKQLEDKYQKNPNANHRYETEDDDRVIIDMSKMLGHDQYGQFEVRRTDHSKPKVLVAELPKTWTGKLDVYGEDWVTPGSAEYIQVEQNFRKTIGAAALQQVLEVRRVQNPTLYRQYALLRQDVAKKLNKKESEVETVPLWHGTGAATVSKINAGKFDRGLAGRNGTAYGAGSYFARDSAYAFHYAKPGPNGDRYMIQTRVLTGEWTQGAQGIKAAPYKTRYLQYDSVVDNVSNPGIFVVFNDASAYPEYIVKFR